MGFPELNFSVTHSLFPRLNMHPRESFMAGHNLSYCVTYFDQVLMATRLASSNDSDAQTHSQQMITQLQKVAPNFVARLKHIQQIATEHGLDVGKLPALPQDYRHWAPLVFEKFTSTWAVDDTDGWFFLLGHALGELRAGIIIMSMSIDFQMNLSLSFQNSIDGFMSELPDMLERWENAILRLLNTPYGADFLTKNESLGPAFDAIHQIRHLPIEQTAQSLLPLLRHLSAQLAQIEQHEAAALPSDSDVS